ncbi:MAG: dienelactone hydrolase family protein [Candidatus Thiodiazotropha endolucinida]|uniref:Dienelactone hydrolase family protein n=1 Tax=Candidatus Thiodiazotropha endolucinida TaxID=1655433 RepID=A0A7Z1AF07_9GAMM|nr:dienelactone hydrolase family protein [Candidatus Thiodiazotropha endolucinida]ODJ87387.1 dienelactone hydrolase family protein [Candidatus Thiodiazotropha endolucinida]
MGRKITLKTSQDEPFSAYLTGDKAAASAVMILHEWWGVMPHNRLWADRLADIGHLALVVDLYDGRTTDDPELAAEMMRNIDQQRADRKLLTAIDFLHTTGRRVASFGCSFGGKESMRASLLQADKVSATIVAYCRMETEVERLKKLSGPVLAIYARQERNWPEKQEAFETAMKAAGKQTESVGFDAAHGFTNPTSPRYDEAADKASWACIVDFLQRYLG